MAITSHEFLIKHKNIEYKFKSPSFADEMLIGMTERNIRRDLERKAGNANPVGDVYGLDNDTYIMVRAVAVFQTLLTSCDDAWPYKKGPNGEFMGVDYNEWDSGRTGDAISVYLLYSDENMRFRQERINAAPSGTPVASSADPEPKSI